ncbi:MAG: hypothetical protein AAF533_20185 [Acidobacteriota bacterium]
MSAKNYKVGAEVEAWCTKCKFDRIHHIETLKSDGNINRVICPTCEGSRLFRRPKGDGTKKKASTTRRRRKNEFSVTEEELATAKPYAIDGAFEAGTIIAHAKFGPGRVMTLRAGGKMEVAFQEGPKLLLCRDVGTFTTTKRGRAAVAALAAASAKAEAEESSDDDKEESSDKNEENAESADAGDGGSDDGDNGDDN